MNEHHPEYKCIWSLNDERLPIDGNAKVVRRNSLAYHKVMARSQYFVNNVNFDESYRKRKGQIEIQTMHGTPLKTLGWMFLVNCLQKKLEENSLKNVIVGII